MIYSFRFKGTIREGMQVRHVEAASLVEATAIAQEWVSRRPGATYIPNSVEEWLISLTQLPPAVQDQPEPFKTEAPTLGEQKERLKAQAGSRKAGTGVGSDPQPSGRVGA